MASKIATSDDFKKMLDNALATFGQVKNAGNLRYILEHIDCVFWMDGIEVEEMLHTHIDNGAVMVIHFTDWDNGEEISQAATLICVGNTFTVKPFDEGHLY